MNLLTALFKDGLFEQNIDARLLESILFSPDALQKEGSPEKFTVAFALGRAKSRLESATRASRKHFGLETLIENLSRLPKDDFLDFYNLEARGLLGTCFVHERRIVGYEFVVKGGSRSLPGLHRELL